MSSLVNKCSHGVYLASTEEVKTNLGRYCSFCTPEVDSDVLRRKELNETKWSSGHKKRPKRKLGGRFYGFDGCIPVPQTSCSIQMGAI